METCEKGGPALKRSLLEPPTLMGGLTLILNYLDMLSYSLQFYLNYNSKFYLILKRLDSSSKLAI